MPLIDCEVNLILTWSSSFCVTQNSGGAVKFAITDVNRYVPVITLPIQDTGFQWVIY